jgi:hypothetical protein
VDYTKLPIWLICKYIWDHATGQVDGQTAIGSNIWDITQYSITGLDAEITSITVNAGVATIITDTAHGMSAGRLCNITGVNSTYNGVHKVSQVDSTTQFRIQAPVGASTVASTTGNVAEIGLIPFYPVYENLGIDTSKLPYIIYDYLFVQPNGTFHPINKERATLTIVGSAPQIFYVKNYIYDILKKFDVSAQDMNNHLDDSEVSFKYVSCDQSGYMIDEKSVDNLEPGKFQTSLILTYEFTKS